MNALQNNVIEQLGYSEDDLDQTSCCYDELTGTLSDICQYGMANGFGQFVYYSDTVKFFDDNKPGILALVEELADSLGEDMLSMIASLNCLKGDYSQTEIMNAIYNQDDENESVIKNALTWFAAEECSHQILNDLGIEV